MSQAETKRFFDESRGVARALIAGGIAVVSGAAKGIMESLRKRG